MSILCLSILFSYFSIVTGQSEPILENALKASPLKIIPLEAATVYLPPLVRKEGKITVIRFKSYISAPIPSGCNWNLSMQVNDTNIRQKTPEEKDRTLGRSPILFLAKGDRSFSMFNGKSIMVFFAPNATIADFLTKDNQAATYCFDITDLTHGVDGNSITFKNLLKVNPYKDHGQLIVENIEVGYMSLNAFKQNKVIEKIPERGNIATGIKTTALELAQGRSGGFAIREPGGLELLVETAVGLDPQINSRLRAEDSVPKNSNIKSVSKILGKNGYAIQAEWKGITLNRTLEIQNNLIIWKELWINTGNQTIAIPFHHYAFLRNINSHYYIGGTDLTQSLVSSPGNPTIFIQSDQVKGRGFGITAESDWLRLLMSFAIHKGIGEIYSTSLALEAGKTIAFEMTITPVGKDGYWGFINSVRNRWHINGITMPRPVFWGYKKANIDGNQEQVVKASLGHLGPIILCTSPWQRLQPDASEVKVGRYPKLIPGAQPAPGKCPDFDVATFLSYKHREKYGESLKKEVDSLKKAIPNIKIIQMMHPAMEVVYKPLKEKWPIAKDLIRQADGTAFESTFYSKTWLGEMIEKDWGVLYYSPQIGSPQFKHILSSINWSLDEIGLDGIYADEFSFAGPFRNYSRYDYTQWDGHSADIDDTGKVIHLKSDNGFSTIPVQAQIVNEIRKRNKFFLGNSASASRVLDNIPHFRFVEGSNGTYLLPSIHLSACPLVYGNMSDNSNLKEIMEDVRECLKYGTVYSPKDINLLLPDENNFVSKLYPITVREIGPGWVLGNERIATIVSGKYLFPKAKGKINFYYYNENGQLEDFKTIRPDSVGKPFDVYVLKNGITIAELVQK
jgi:hypothetical protein